MAYSQEYEFFAARADEAAIAAREASLENVRQRELRSERAWRIMAERRRVTDTNRKRQVEAKAMDL